MKQVILASASPRRRELLGLWKIDFQVVPARKEEVLTTREPGEAVCKLSRQKAEEVAGQFGEGSLVIGADTVVVLDGEILGKPGSEKGAFDMLYKLQGHTHSVFTGVTVAGKEKGENWSLTFAEETKVTVARMTEAQIWNYVNLGESLDKAGAYAMQGFFGTFVEKIEGDYNNVIGLPLSRLYRELAAVGREPF